MKSAEHHARTVTLQNHHCFVLQRTPLINALAPYMRFLCAAASFPIVSLRVLVPSSGETKEGS